MKIWELARMWSLTGNLAIDVALVTIAIISGGRFILQFPTTISELLARRGMILMLRQEYTARGDRIAALNERLALARQRTQGMLGPYFEERQDRLALVIAAMNKQRDPAFAELEEQLDYARERPRVMSH